MHVRVAAVVYYDTQAGATLAHIAYPTTTATAAATAIAAATTTTRARTILPAWCTHTCRPVLAPFQAPLSGPPDRRSATAAELATGAVHSLSSHAILDLVATTDHMMARPSTAARRRHTHSNARGTCNLIAAG